MGIMYGFEKAREERGACKHREQADCEAYLARNGILEGTTFAAFHHLNREFRNFGRELIRPIKELLE